MAFGNNSDDHWNPLKCSRLTIMGEKWPNGSGTPSLSLVITKAGNIKFVVYKNNGGDSRPAEFECGSPPEPRNLYAILELLEEAINEKETVGVINVFQCKSWFAGGQQRLEKPKAMHSIMITRDEKHRLTLSFQARDSEVIPFPFKFPITFVPLTGAGERLPEATESELAVKAWVKMTRITLGAFIATGLVKPPPKQDRGGQGNQGGGFSGGGNSGGNSGGGFANKSSGGFSDFDDDVI